MSDGGDSVGALTPARAREIASAEGLLALQTVRAAAHLVAQLALVAVLAVAGAKAPLALRPLIWLTLGIVLAGLGGFLHESVHRLAFGRRGANDLAGIAVGSLLLFPFSAYRAFHLAHHAATAVEGDPEGAPFAFTSRLQYAALLPLAGPSFAGVIWLAALRCTFGGRGPAWARHPGRIRRGTLMTLVGVTLIALAAVRWPWLVVTGYLPGLAVTYAIALAALLLPEHYAADVAAPLAQKTRTTHSNAPLTWAFWGANHHAPHHLAPLVPGPSLPRLTRLLDGELSPAWVSSGYLRWHLATFRALPWTRSGAPGAAHGTTTR